MKLWMIGIIAAIILALAWTVGAHAKEPPPGKPPLGPPAPNYINVYATHWCTWYHPEPDWGIFPGESSYAYGSTNCSLKGPKIKARCIVTLAMGTKGDLGYYNFGRHQHNWGCNAATGLPIALESLLMKQKNSRAGSRFVFSLTLRNPLYRWAMGFSDVTHGCTTRFNHLWRHVLRCKTIRDDGVGWANIPAFPQ